MKVLGVSIKINLIGAAEERPWPFLKPGSIMRFDYVNLALVLCAIAVSLIYTFITGISPVSSTIKSRKKIISTISPDQTGEIF